MRKRFPLLFILLLSGLFPSGLLLAQPLDWAKGAGGLFGDQGVGVAVDDLGNSYVTGFFDTTTAFGTGPTIFPKTFGFRDIFIAK